MHALDTKIPSFECSALPRHKTIVRVSLTPVVSSHLRVLFFVRNTVKYATAGRAKGLDPTIMRNTHRTHSDIQRHTPMLFFTPNK